MLLVIDLVNHQHNRFLRFSQHARQLFIHRRQAFFCIDNEKQKIAFVQRIPRGTAHLHVQFTLAHAENPAGVPQCEQARTASVNRRNPVPRNSGLTMNDGNLAANQAIK